jgi:hypothetical protein
MNDTLSAADRIAIEDLFASYHWLLDTADVEAFADLFAGGAIVELAFMHGITRYEGRAGMIDLAESLRLWEPFPGSQHYDDQMLIESDGENRCRVRSFCFVADCRGEPPYLLRFAGRRDDRVVRVDGRWLFEHRYVQLWKGNAMRNHLMEPA